MPEGGARPRTTPREPAWWSSAPSTCSVVSRDLTEEEQQDAPYPPIPSLVQSPDATGTDMTIRTLIVEDEAITARDLAQMVEHLGYAVAGIAASWKEAVALLVATRPDIALIDIRLRGERTGLDLARHIRSHHSMPIVFLTSFSDSRSVSAARELGANAYVLKPYTEDAVFAAIETGFGNFVDDTANSQDHATGNAAKGGLTPSLVTQMSTHIQTHFDEPLTLETLANIAGLSRFHFAAAFKRSFGVPPYRYIIETRIAAAKTLLKTTEETVLSVAGRVGYESQSHFTAVFKRETGQTPSAYRRKHC